MHGHTNIKIIKLVPTLFLVFGFLLYRPMSFESVDEFWVCAVRRLKACGNIGETFTSSVDII